MTDASEQTIKENRGYAATLMLAGVDNPDTFDAAMRALDSTEAARLAAAAIIVGRDVVNLCEKHSDQDPPVAPRRVLDAIIAACRE